MLTRRYGSHSFGSDRDKLAKKMDGFLYGTNDNSDKTIESEDALKILSQFSPDLLIKIAESIQSANKD